MVNLKNYYNKYKYIEHSFHELMPNKVKSILFVSSFYDAFIFEQDGRLAEKIHGEYRHLNLSTSPRVDTVSGSEEALDAVRSGSYQLVVLMMRVDELSPFELSQKIKEIQPDISVLLLLNSNADVPQIEDRKDLGGIDDVFLWSGETRLFLAMIKSVEDKKNIAADMQTAQVRVIIFVEDSINFYSNFLSILYSKIVQQTQELIDDEISDMAKRYRMRVRPKVILVHTYEEAIKYFQKYKDNVLSIISDIRYPKDGKLCDLAGVELAKAVKAESTIPVLLLSSDKSNKRYADELGIKFIHKAITKNLFKEFREFMDDRLGFGNFAFMDLQGKRTVCVKKISKVQRIFAALPDEEFLHNLKRRYFVSWLLTHGYIDIVKDLPELIKRSEVEPLAIIRQGLTAIFHKQRQEMSRGKIIPFSVFGIYDKMVIHSLARGSVGGKGRGLAFLSALLTTLEYENKYESVEIMIPRTFLIGTDEYDEFLQTIDFDSEQSYTYTQIGEIFKKGKLSKNLKKNLRNLLRYFDKPLAVRSSGMLEDSEFHPFAGIYSTYMLPNSSEDIEMRFANLVNAIKMVYASVFKKEARSYIEGLNFNIGEEKMAVIIQQIVGSQEGDYFFPHIAGVAQSYNFYPTGPMESSDGVAELVFGLGEMAVRGQQNVRVCPNYPKINALDVEQVIKNSQDSFISLNLKEKLFDFSDEICTLVELDKKEARNNAGYKLVVSTQDLQSGRLDPGFSENGFNVISFANVLIYDYIPLAEILADILRIGQMAMATPVEIEFALVFDKKHPGCKAKFNLLQIRPLSINNTQIKLEKEDFANSILTANRCMGGGRFTGLNDVIYLDMEKFDNTKTLEMQEEIERFNKKMVEQNRKYVLIGIGRWGTRDRFLGIPVSWGQISRAKVIVELGKEDFVVEASQGTHFFHNLISANVCYLTLQESSDFDYLNWEKMKRWSVVEKGKYFIHRHSPQDLEFLVDSNSNNAVWCETKK